MISEAMARAFWPDESAVGKVFYGGRHDPDTVTPETANDRPGEVIGVVEDVRNRLEQEPSPTAYFHRPMGGRILFLRTTVDPAGLIDVLRREIEAVDPNEIQVTQIRTIEQIVAEQSADSRFRAQIVIFFAVLAMGIACLGLFGVLTYAVSQRTRELGIRMSLGAGSSRIAGLVLGQGARIAGLGVALGLVVVLGATRYISSLLFGVEPLDETTLAGVAALIFALTLLATYLPTRRALRVDPIEALRHD